MTDMLNLAKVGDMPKAREALVVALNRSGVIGAARHGYFDALFECGRNSPAQRKKEFGLYYYENSVTQQIIPANTWTTIDLDGLGPNTSLLYAPEGVGDILIPGQGGFDLSNLSLGDEIYIRHVINVTPSLSGTDYMFSHLIGSEPQGFRLPTLSESLGGAGRSTGWFVIDTHFFLQTDQQRITGMFPQIYGTGTLTINHFSTYLSISRREV